MNKKRLEIAAMMLPELMRSAEAVAYCDKEETIQYLVKIAYRYADKLLQFENIKTDDIPDTKPVVPNLQMIAGPGRMLIPKGN